MQTKTTYKVERLEEVVIAKKCKVREVWNENQTCGRILYRGKLDGRETTQAWMPHYHTQNYDRGFSSLNDATSWIAEHGNPNHQYRIVVIYPVSIKQPLNRVELTT